MIFESWEEPQSNTFITADAEAGIGLAPVSHESMKEGFWTAGRYSPSSADTWEAEQMHAFTTESMLARQQFVLALPLTPVLEVPEVLMTTLTWLARDEDEFVIPPAR